MTFAAGLLAVALLLQPRPVYHWRDAGGQVHVTDTPPPPGAERVDSPPPPAVEPGHPEPPLPRVGRLDSRRGTLTPAQQAAWKALEQRLAQARAAHDTRTMKAVADSLIDDCLWGGGLWTAALVPLLAVALMGLMGWWLALGMGPGARLPLLAGFLLAGLAFGQLLLASFLYHPQALRLRENLQILELHTGSGRDLRPANRARLQEDYQALFEASDPLELPWRFPAQVATLREHLRQVIVDP